MPRIIDFGVAKAMGHDMNADTVYTHAGSIVGTLGYMSPEQAGSLSRDIDTRADVYSLGVVLYELLVGVLPFEFHCFALGEALWRLRQENAARPSARLRALGPEAAATCHNRGTDIATLARQLRGDADAIVLKALEKDRERRYSTPLEVAADIGRYLRHEPVTAHETSLAYRAGKYARRHWIGMTVATAFVVVLIAAATVTIRQSIRANREAAVAQAVNDFLQNDLLARAGASEQARPNVNPDPDIKVRTALDRAAARIEGKFHAQPLVESSIRETIGTTYEDLGLYPEAQKQLERALDLRRSTLGEKNPDTLNSMNHLAELYRVEGKYAQAEPLNARVVEIRRRLAGEEDPGTLTAMHNLASVYGYQNKYAEAEALFKKVIEIQRRVLGEGNSSTFETMHDLATLYQRQGDYPQAEPLYLKSMEGFQRVLGEEHPETLVSMSGVAVIYEAQGKYAEADELESKVLAIQRRVLGEEHLYTLNTMSHLAWMYADEGKGKQAEELYLKTLAIQRRVLGDEHPETLLTMTGLGNVYRNQGNYSQAEMLYTKSLAIQSRALGVEYRDTRGTISSLGELYRLQHRYVQAEELLAKVLEIRRRLTGEDHPDTLASINRLATLYVDEGKYAQAEALAREALTGYERAKLDTWERFHSQSLLGVSLTRQGKYMEAEPLLVEGYQGMLARKNRIPVPNLYNLDRAREWTAELYRAWRRPDKAAWTAP